MSSPRTQVTEKAGSNRGSGLPIERSSARGAAIEPPHTAQVNLRLYGSPTSTATQRVLLLYAEKSIDGGIDCRVDVTLQQHLTPDYLALNPLGTVPTLVADGRILTDSLTILEFLNNTFPAMPNLVPASSRAQAIMRDWMQQIDADDSIRILTFQQRLVPRFAAMSAEAFAAVAAAHPTRADWYRQMGQSGFDAATLADAKVALRQLFGDADGALQANDWLAGRTMSLADLVLLPSVERAIALGLEATIRVGSALARWHANMRARRSFGAVFR